MSNLKTHSERIEELRENKRLLTSAFQALRRNEAFTVVRLTKSEQNSFAKVWELAASQLKFTSVEDMEKANPKLIICRKINETKTNITDNLRIHFNCERKVIVDKLKEFGLVVKNESASDECAIIVEMIKK